MQTEDVFQYQQQEVDMHGKVSRVFTYFNWAGFSLKLKVNVHTGCIISCLIYGSETWTIKAEHEVNWINSAKMRCFKNRKLNKMQTE